MPTSVVFFIAGLSVGFVAGGWIVGQWVFNHAQVALEKIVRRVLMHGFDRDYMRNAVEKSGFFAWIGDRDKTDGPG